jgi:multidrug efflux system outer membrane protein
MPQSSPTVRPDLDMPKSWPVAPSEGRSIAVEKWWTVYADRLLDRLVAEGLAQNTDIALAVARVEEARALVEVTEANRRPSIDAAANADRSRSSQRTATPLQGGSPERSNLRLTLNAAYEIDLWDRLKNASGAARKELLAAQAARDIVRIAVAASIARSYFALRALDAQLATAQRTIGVREEALALQRKRVEAGVLAELDLRQIEAELAAVRAQIPPLLGERGREEAALGVLLGRSPRAILAGVVEKRSDADLGLLPPVVPPGLPSQLLLRRPDIIEAERRLEAADLRVAIARVGHFPSITLTGYLGTESAVLSSLFTGPAGIWQAAALLAQPVFAGGRLEAEVDAADARARQALARYQTAIQNAFRDVRAALIGQAQARASAEAEQDRVLALAETVRLARLRYEGGLASQIELLDAQRNLLAAELNRIEALRAHRAAIANLMQALGGGWE